MNNVVENGLTISIVGTSAYLGLSWLQDMAVEVFNKIALMLPVLGG